MGMKGELQGAKASIVWWEHFSPFQSSVFHSLVETNPLEPTEFGTGSALNIIAFKTQLPKLEPSLTPPFS